MRDLFPRIEIGTIGDARHRLEISDHNPNGYGRVNAADFMIGTGGFTQGYAVWLCAWLTQDSRTKYVIYNHRIWNPRHGWNDYTGSDPHTGHVHLSVNDIACTNIAPWKLSGRKVTMENLPAGSLPVLRQGDKDPVVGPYMHVHRVQQLLYMNGDDADGIYGPKTSAAVKAKMANPAYDGKMVDAKVWAKLLALMPPVK